MPKDNLKEDTFAEKDLARLGDAIVNLIASAILTLHAGLPRGVKVSNKVLTRVYNNIFKGKAPPNRDKATFIEYCFAYIWLKRDVSIDDMIKNAFQYIKEKIHAKPSEKEEYILVEVLTHLLERYLGE